MQKQQASINDEEED